MSADRYTDAYDVYVRWQSKREGRLKLEKNFEEEVKCEKESEMEKEEALRVSEDILSDPVTYELQVNKSLIKCSKRVIASSHLLLDMIDLTDPKDDSPIPIPPFITKQIILDLVEMVEKGDMECAHLGKTIILWERFSVTFSYVKRQMFQFLFHSRTCSTSSSLLISSAVTNSRPV